MDHLGAVGLGVEEELLELMAADIRQDATGLLL
jgi:hypothetical protein